MIQTAGRIDPSDGAEIPGSGEPVAVVTSVVHSPDETEWRSRIRARWVYGGFGIGLVLGFVVTAVHVALSGWRILPFQLVLNLIWCPYLCALIGYNRCPVPRDGSGKRLRLHTRFLMVLIAYVALLFGMGVTTGRLGTTALRYYNKYSSSESMAKVFREQARKSELEARQKLGSAAQLRSGKIPESLLQIQKDFLRSLDRTATPEYRKLRYGMIADGEERVGKLQERNAMVYRGLTEYHEELAAKYDRAQRRPWLPVAPDPPMPPTQ